MMIRLDNYCTNKYTLSEGELQKGGLLLVAVCQWREAAEREFKPHWPQALLAKILIAAEGGSTKAMCGATKCVEFGVSYKWENIDISPTSRQHRDALNMKSKTSFLTPCQGFLTSNTLVRSWNVSPASVFRSPSGNRVKNGVAPLPLSKSHLDDSHPYSESVFITFGLTEEKPKSTQHKRNSRILLL